MAFLMSSFIRSLSLSCGRTVVVVVGAVEFDVVVVVVFVAFVSPSNSSPNSF